MMVLVPQMTTSERCILMLQLNNATERTCLIGIRLIDGVMLALLLSLAAAAARSECRVDCTSAAGSIANELVGAFELESADCGDCAGDLPPFVWPSMLLLLFFVMD